MASNAKKTCKSWLYIVTCKKHLGRGNFVLFSNLFHHFREHPIVFKFKQDPCHEVRTCQLIYIVPHSHIISIFFYVSKLSMKFCQNRKSVTDEIWNPGAWCKPSMYSPSKYKLPKAVTQKPSPPWSLCLENCPQNKLIQSKTKQKW